MSSTATISRPLTPSSTQIKSDISREDRADPSFARIQGSTNRPSENEDSATASERAHSLLDAIYADARQSHTQVVIRLDRPGKFLKLTSLSDEELAAVALNRDRSFSHDEQLTARCEFTERTRVALEPFKDAAIHGDRRGYAIAINYIYSCMTPEVREATQWTPEMISSNNEMLEGDVKRLGPIDKESVLHALLATARSGRSLNLSPLRQRLFTYDLTAATTRRH